MDISWEEGFQIRTNVTAGGMVISANREGMLSLANILRDLAEEDPGTHVHLDEHNSLDDGSCDLILDRVE